MNETEQINRIIPVILQESAISRAINEKKYGRKAIFQDLTLFILLSNLAYADWSNGVPSDNNDNWNTLYKKGYRFVAQCPNDPATGYSGTIFYNTITKKYILANRGTTKTDLNDAAADIDILKSDRMPYGQFESMVKFIDNSVLASAPFDVTGHSLGGFLAQVAKATFSNAEQVYTYNALGAKNLIQYVNEGIQPNGKVKVSFPGSSLFSSYEWEQSTWAAYQRFMGAQGNTFSDI